jgi:hypothetical protein
LLKESDGPETNEQLTSKYPVCSTMDEIVKSAKSFGSISLEILKCPLTVDVLSSIVLKKDCLELKENKKIISIPCDGVE